MITVTKRFEFCYAHHLPGHEKCGNIHGHNGVMEVEISGDIDHDGMIIDFKMVDSLVKRLIIDVWDHKDLNTISEFKDVLPTAENMVILASQFLREHLKIWYRNIKLERVRLYETSNCWAEWTR